MAKKWWFIGCGVAGFLGIVGCGGLIAAIIYFAFAATKPVVTASDEFLDLLAQGKTAEAYASCASGLHARLDEPSFTEAVKKLGLTEYKESSWNKRNINNDDGMVEGTITKKDGSSTPATIRLVHEGGKWKVSGVRVGGAELTSLQRMPDDDDLQRIVRKTLLDFDKAVKLKDFTDFHAAIAESWKKEITAKDLQQTFHEFIDKEISLSGVSDLRAIFAEPPKIDDDGVLKMQGHYATRPLQVNFELRYMHEAPGWRLIGINLSTGVK